MNRRKGIGKGIAALLAAVLVSSTWTFGGADTVKAADVSNGTVTVKAADNKVPTYEYQKAKDFVLNITNTGDKEITDFKIEPVLQKEDGKKWPFKTDYQDYSAKLDKLGAGESKQIKFSFTERDNIDTARYTIHFEHSYRAKVDKETAGEEETFETFSGTTSFYVNTTAKPAEKKTAGTTSKEETKTPKKAASDIGVGEDISAGGYSNGGAVYSDGGSGDGGGSSDGSVPRVIVTGFSTNPKKVKAGSDFTLTIHLRNTSKKSRVKNMLFDLNAPEEGADEQTTAPAFLPSSGSSSIYLEGMKAGGTADISIKLNAKSDLLQKPYSVELSMKYEDSGSNAVEAASSISIPVKQDARFEFSDFEISPESIAVDDEANVMCSLYNLGRIKLYNVKAIFEGDSIEKEEVFVGNVESGATASIDAMLKGTKATEGPAPVTMTMSYENEEGEVSIEKKELMLEVTESTDEAMDEGMEVADDQAGGGLPIIPIIAVVVIAVAIAAVVIIKKRKKKKGMEEEEDFLYELDGSSDDERQ